MKRSLLFGGIGLAVLAVTIPAGAVIQNQVSRPKVEAKADTQFVEPPTATFETTTTVKETPPPATEPTVPPTTEAKREPEPTRPAPPKPVEFVLRLECATRTAENVTMNVCHWGEPNVDGVMGYHVWRAIGDNPREVIGRTEGHEWSERNAKPGVRYAYVIEAVGENGVSIGFSNKAAVAAPVPPKPFKLACVPKLGEGKLGVVCEWSVASNDRVRAYQLCRTVGDGARELVTTVPADGARRYFDTNVQRGQIIVYSLVAIDGDGATVVATDGVRVVIPTETPTTTAKPVDTTRPKEPGVTTTVK
jgi:hypothetical protein